MIQMKARTPELVVPLDDATEGHLIVRRGLGAVTITTDPRAPELLTGRWQGRRTPRAKVHRGTVVLSFPRASLGWGAPAHELVLNGSIPWRIEVDGGMGEVEADLSQAGLQDLDIRGGVAQTRIDLPAPTGTLAVRMGGASDVVVTRPRGVPTRVRVHRGARDVALDGQSFGAIGGSTVLADPGFETAPDRIDLIVQAASHLTVTDHP